MATPIVSVPDVPTPLSPIARMIGVFFSPKPTFADIARRPSWIAPVVVMTLVSIVASIALNQRVNWQEFIGKQIDESSRGSQLSAEQRQQQVEGGAKITTTVVYVVGLLGTLSIVLLVALVFWGAYNLLAGTHSTFSQSLGIVSHAYLPSLVSGAILILVLYLRAKGDVNVQNPVAANLGAFIPDNSAKWLTKLASSIDIFSIWITLLIAIGFTPVNPKKLRGATPFAIAFGVWALYVVIGVGWAFIFS